MTAPGRIQPQTMVFKRAERVAVKLKILVIAPSGGGKTIGSLLLAQGLAGENIALADSENDRGLFYCDPNPAFKWSGVFNHLSLKPFGYRPKAYMDAIDVAVNAGIGALVIDSLTHSWDDVLTRKEAYDRANPGSNGFANWKHFTKEWDALVRHILDAPIHIIATARSKQSYELTENDKGKKKVEKMGLQPQIREGTEYEFAVVMDVLPSHAARCTKDNTGMFGTSDEELWNLTDGKVPAMLIDWLSGAKPAPIAPPTPVYAGPFFPKLKGSEKYEGLPLRDVPREIIEDCYRRANAAGTAKGAEIAAMMENELERLNNLTAGDFGGPATGEAPSSAPPPAPDAPIINASGEQVATGVTAATAPTPAPEREREPGEEPVDEAGDDPTIFGKAATPAKAPAEIPGAATPSNEEKQTLRNLANGMETHWMLGIEAHLARASFSFDDAKTLFDVLSDPVGVDMDALRKLLGTNAPPQSRKLSPKPGAVADALKPNDKAGVLKTPE